jgi:hypothetical protein
VGVGVGVGVGVSFRFLNFPGACFVKVMDALEKKCVYECVCVCVLVREVIGSLRVASCWGMQRKLL